MTIENGKSNITKTIDDLNKISIFFASLIIGIACLLLGISYKIYFVTMFGLGLVIIFCPLYFLININSILSLD